jgi:hypothetical protein
MGTRPARRPAWKLGGKEERLSLEKLRQQMLAWKKMILIEKCSKAMIQQFSRL